MYGVLTSGPIECAQRTRRSVDFNPREPRRRQHTGRGANRRSGSAWLLCARACHSGGQANEQDNRSKRHRTRARPRCGKRGRLSDRVRRSL